MLTRGSPGVWPRWPQGAGGRNGGRATRLSRGAWAGVVPRVTRRCLAVPALRVSGLPGPASETGFPGSGARALRRSRLVLPSRLN